MSDDFIGICVYAHYMPAFDRVFEFYSSSLISRLGSDNKCVKTAKTQIGIYAADDSIKAKLYSELKSYI